MKLKGIGNALAQHEVIPELTLPKPYFNRNENPAWQPGQPSGHNWISLRAENESRLIHIDNRGIIYLPDPGILIETWFYRQGRLDMPPNIQPAGQQPMEFYGVTTRVNFSGGSCNIHLFPISAVVERFAVKTPLSAAGHLIGAEYYIQSEQEMRLKEIMLLYIIRPLPSENGPPIRCLEYQENYLWVNGVPLLYFPKSPGHSCFCSGNEEALFDYLLLREGNNRAKSQKTNCSGLIGYSGLVEELNGTVFYLNYSQKKRIFAGGLAPFYRTSSELIWRERYQRQKGMIDAGEPLNTLFFGAFPHLLTFSRVATDSFSPYLILILNRLGLYNESREWLQKGIDNAVFMNIIKNYGVSCRLPFLIHDYVQFSGDRQFLTKCRGFLKTMANWMLYHSGFSLPKNCVKNENLIWFCASLKSMAGLMNIMNRIRESAEYLEDYFRVRTLIIRQMRETLNKVGRFGFQAENSDGMNLLAAIYPLNLCEPGDGLTRGFLDMVHRGYSGSKGLNLHFMATLSLVIQADSLDVRPFLNCLIETGKGAWNWPDVMEPDYQTGIGARSHDPETLFRVLLLVRNLFVREDQDVLELAPGFPGEGTWRRANLRLREFPTRFGTICCEIRQVGLIVELKLAAEFRKKPWTIRIRRKDGSNLTYCDTWFREMPDYWEFGPELRRLRFKFSAVSQIDF